MSLLKKLFVPILVLLPTITSAQLEGTSGLFQAALDIVRDILIPLAFILSLLFFFWGVAMYIRSEGTGKEEGKKIMIWGVVALFVMSSVWGLVTFLRVELGIGDDSSLPIPTVGGSGAGSDLNL